MKVNRRQVLAGSAATAAAVATGVFRPAIAASEPILAELDHFKSTQLASVAYADEASH